MTGIEYKAVRGWGLDALAEQMTELSRENWIPMGEPIKLNEPKDGTPVGIIMFRHIVPVQQKSEGGQP